MKYGKIKLHPTLFCLHVFLKVEDLESLEKQLNTIFPGEKWKGYVENLENNNISAYVETREINKETTILMVLKDSETEVPVILHEIVHVLHDLSSLTQVETGPEATEWNAYFQEYVYTEISKVLEQ